VGFSGGGGSFTADGVTLETTSGGITRVKDGGLGTAKLSFTPKRVIDSDTLTADGTTLSLTGLSLGGVGVYRLDYSLVNATATGGYVSIYVNGDTTVANYAWQDLSANNTSIGASRTNSTHITYLPASDTGLGSMILGVGAGQIFTVKNMRATGLSSILMQHVGIQKKDVYVPTITSLSVVGDYNFSAGSWIKLTGYD